tara:strand:+ start:2176 stop:2823 length:648 start_codon:yes stop_codon:yes gene_type:complete
MRYALLHYSSFIPLAARALTGDSKIAILCYFFATYVLLEHKPWNGYPISTWHDFQRRGEVALMWCMSLNYWLGHTWFSYLSLIPLAIIPWKVHVDAISYSVSCFALFRYNPVQILAVASMVVAEQAKQKTQLFNEDDWHDQALHRVNCRGVQVLALTMCYQTTWQQCVTVLIFSIAKSVVWMYTLKPSAQGYSAFATQTPVRLRMQVYVDKQHTL